MPSDMAKALGLGTTLSFEGVDHKVAPLRFGIQGAYSAYLRQRAKAALDEFRPLLTPEEYREQLAYVTTRDPAAGVYTFGNPLTMESLSVKDNLEHLLWLCLKEFDPQASKTTAKRLIEGLGADKVMEALHEANADPNVKTPATTDVPLATTERPSKSFASTS